MNAILIFIGATIVNVTLSTIRSLCTINGGKWVSAITNAICYGFYPLIVMLTAKGTVGIIVNMCITAVVNFACVWVIKFVEEKAKKDKLWKIEVAIPTVKTVEFHHLLDVPHNYLQVGEWTMFNCYCESQADTQKVVDLAKQYNGKISAYESKAVM